MNGSVQPNRLIDNEFLQRFCARDVTLWAVKDEDKKEEVAHRLDWLDAGSKGEETIQLAEKLLDGLVLEGFSHAVVLGMGGSSLAPEVFSKIFQIPDDKRTNRLELSILDTTDPVQIEEKRKELPIGKTLFIVSSKSGGTAEVNALEAYFWEELIKSGIEKPGSHFIAITDPGTSLEKKGIEKYYRQVILANPNVGGRYSALIEFGLVPAVLIGIDCRKLLKKTKKMEIPCSDFQSVSENPGLMLGGFLTEAYNAGRDKLTIIADPDLKSLGSWIEQLIAESSGKNGKGILPIDLEPFQEPNFYGDDRIFVYFSKDGRYNAFLEKLANSGNPTITFRIDDPYDLGAEFLRWETAIAVACALIGVNAFDQPNVQLSKSITQQMIAEIKKDSGLAEQKPIFNSDELDVFTEEDGLRNSHDIGELIENFLRQSKPGDFVGINAFVNRDTDFLSGLQQFRVAIANKTNLATTLGFGPRFLHSTGQIHKGGKNNGHFLIITAERENDIDIPGEGMSFGTLQIAQTIGDMRALQQMNRHVIRLHFKKGKLNPEFLARLII
jgi:glucose-6-phosphate isomerase